MKAGPGEIEPTLWHGQTDDFDAESLFPLLKIPDGLCIFGGLPDCPSFVRKPFE